MTYPPFLSRLARTRTVDLVAQYVDIWPERTLPRTRLGELHYERLVVSLLDWATASGLAYGQVNVGFITWNREVSLSLRGRYGKDAA